MATTVSFELKKLTDREIRVVVKDKDKHSLPNLISRLALSKPYVVYAAYIIDHPLVSDPEIVIVTDGTKHPLDVLKEVAEEAKELAKKMLEEFDRALKEYSRS